MLPKTGMIAQPAGERIYASRKDMAEVSYSDSDIAGILSEFTGKEIKYFFLSPNFIYGYVKLCE